MHAHDRGGLHAGWTVDVLEVDHGVAAVGVALGASLHAGLAADAARLIQEEFVFGKEV